MNYGWRGMEGAHCFSPSSGCVRTGRTLPVTEYGHSGSRCSITGGYVYRGKAYPDLVGAYLFADYCSGEIWYIDRGAARGVTPTRATDTSSQITSFGEDRGGRALRDRRGWHRLPDQRLMTADSARRRHR